MTVSQTQIVSSEIVVDAATYAPTRSYNTDVRGADWVIHSAFLLNFQSLASFWMIAPRPFPDRAPVKLLIVESPAAPGPRAGAKRGDVRRAKNA